MRLLVPLVIISPSSLKTQIMVNHIQRLKKYLKVTHLFFKFLPPQTKFAKVMFLHLSVSHSVHRVGVSDPVHADNPPSGADTPLRSAC